MSVDTSSRLEWILCDAQAFGLTTASPLQRAICRCLDGVPLGDLAGLPEVVEAFGGTAAVASLPREQPAELVLLASIRAGKSLIAGACAVRAGLTCDVSKLGPGEVPRVSIVSLSVDTARATWAHVRGRVEASPTLRAMLVEEPTADALVLRHPSGRHVEIKVVAGSRAAGSLVARWSAGVIFDEAPRMVGAEDGVINLDDARHAVLGRLLPGAQVLLIGSPWAPFGPVYDLVQEHWGKPSRDIVIVRATGPTMHPAHWTVATGLQLIHFHRFHRGPLIHPAARRRIGAMRRAARDARSRRRRRREPEWSFPGGLVEAVRSSCGIPSRGRSVQSAR